MATNQQESTEEPRARKALVLGGGGGFGVVQAAYIEAAYERGFRPDIVVGTSVGALNGAWIALHPDDPKGLLQIWRGLSRHKVLHLNPFGVAGRMLRRRMGLSRNSIVPHLLAEHIGDRCFEDTILPLAIVATNLTAGRKHVFDRGSLADAIAASTAIPGVYDPVELRGELFVDGCVTASLDLQTALDLGATEILAIDLTPEGATANPRTPMGVLRRSFDILSHSATDAMQAAATAHARVRVVRPDLSKFSPWRISVSEEDVEGSLRAARAGIRAVLDAAGNLVPALEPAPQFAFAPVAIRANDAPMLARRSLAAGRE